MAFPSPSRPFTRRAALSTICAAAALPRIAFAADAPSAPEDPAALAAKRKINLAGRQRMLTQRMAKAAAFVRLGLEPQRHMEMMRVALALFERTLIGLRHGDEELGLTPTTHPKVLRSLSIAESAWEPYAAAIYRALAAGDVDDAALAEIAQLNMPALKTMNDAVSAFENAYGDKDLPLGLAIAINIAGRQRMLSQKMSKEAALCALRHDRDANRAALGQTSTLFDLSLTALTEGLPTVSLIEPPTPEIESKLQEVAGLWAAFKPLADAISHDDAPGTDEAAAIAARNDALLFTMNEAVWLYEHA